MASYDFDLFTIGAGSGGVAASRRAAAYGARVAICEGSKVGGTCVIRGCVPKKLLVYGGQFRDAFEDAVGYGWDASIPEFHWGKLLDAKDRDLVRKLTAQVLDAQISDIVMTEAGLLEKLRKEPIAIRELSAFDPKPAIEAFDKIWLPKAPQIAELRAVGATL